MDRDYEGYTAMKMDGKKIVLSYKPIAYYDSSIGRLAIFSISFSHNQGLRASLAGDLSSCDPTDFVKKLLLYICYPIEALGEKENKPDAVVLSDEDIDRLTENEINEIAELYVKNESYLYQKLISERKTDESGKQMISLSYGEVEHPKEEGESNVQYLHRLYVIQEKKQKEEMARFSKSLLGGAKFSSQSFKNIANTLSMGNSIAKATDAMRFPGITDSLAKAAEALGKLHLNESLLASIHKDIAPHLKLTETMPVFPKTDFGELAEKAAKARWAPFKALAERLDNLIDVSSNSVTFIVEMNKTQTAIASEIKASGEHASRLSKWNIGLTIAVVFLTIVGVTLVWLERSRSSEDAQALRQYADGIRSDLKSVADELSSNGKSADDRLKVLLDEARQVRINENSRIDKILSEYLKNVERLRLQQATNRQTIEQLRARISELENQLKESGRNLPPSGDK